MNNEQLPSGNCIELSFAYQSCIPVRPLPKIHSQPQKKTRNRLKRMTNFNVNSQRRALGVSLAK